MDNNNRYYNKDPMFYDDDINNEVFSSRYDFDDRRYDSIR
jgi:hypothetical protein